MKIKSFYADSMDVALQSASKEMGEEALILNTREAPAEFKHFGKYEVVCAVAHVASPSDQERPEAIQEFLTVTPEPKVKATKKAKAAQKGNTTARLVFLVGPSGAGKSATCAKIAIQSKFTQDLIPAVVSWDSGRVGGGDCVRSYCEIAGVLLREVEDAAGFRAAIEDFKDCDIVLVDTPAIEGTGMINEEIAAAIDLYPGTEVHLVLSGTYSNTYLKNACDAYACFQPTYLLPTHLDQARMDLGSTGMERLSALTIGWCGIGRGIPEDLEDASRVVERAAALAAKPLEQEADSIEDFIAPSAKPAAETHSARTAIEGILARFRRADLNASSKASKSSAA